MGVYRFSPHMQPVAKFRNICFRALDGSIIVLHQLVLIVMLFSTMKSSLHTSTCLRVRDGQLDTQAPKYHYKIKT